MADHGSSSLPTRRSFIRVLVRLGGAGITLSALTQSDLARRPVYAQNGNGHGNGNGNGNGNDNGNGTSAVAPEIGAGAAASALALLSGAAFLLSDRARRRRRSQ